MVVFTFVCVPQTFPDFNEIIFCNIGNPQALGLRPMEFPRQVLSMVACPTLIENGTAGSVFPPDAVERAKAILAATASENGMGAYTHSKGLPLVRESIARFIADRDGHPCDPEAVFCTNGASAGISSVMNLLIRDSSDGIMIPIPQYPLYSATMTLLGGASVGYYLNEENGWSMEVDELERARRDAEAKGIRVRALAVINPGNPTGQVLGEANMRQVVEFCMRHRIVLLADEVAQCATDTPAL